jgi:rfaE bifunctional protein nucleotidyltransferase chain/domain
MIMQFDTTNWRMEKVLTLAEAGRRAGELRQQGKKLVTVNGSFDIVHAGHLDQLEEAKKQGDILFVGLNDDASVRAAKGKERPLIPEKARAAMLAALICVDFVVIIDKPYGEVPQTLVGTVKPQVHVNGPDYGPVETWIEWPVMQKVGATGYVVQKRNNLSTSALLEKAGKNRT